MNERTAFPSRYVAIARVVLLLVVAMGLTLVGCGPGPTPTPVAPPSPTATLVPPTPLPVPPTVPAEATENLFVYAHQTTFPDIDPSVNFSNESIVVSNAYETLKLCSRKLR